VIPSVEVAEEDNDSEEDNARQQERIGGPMSVGKNRFQDGQRFESREMLE